MPVRYKFNIIAALKEKGYNSNRIRNERLMGQANLQQLRHGELVSWKIIGVICKLLECQPGDFLEYVPDDIALSSSVEPEHPEADAED